MYRHYFVIDEAARDPKPSVYHYKRRFLTLRRDENSDRKLFAGHLETILRKPVPEFSARFHVGTAGSETPWDGHLTILGSGFYWGIENGGKLAHRLTRCKEHKWEGRDLKLSIHDSKLWLKVWVHPDSWTRGHFARWRDRSFKLNPLDILYGEQRYWYEDEAQAVIGVRMPEDTYPVKATLQRQKFGRPKSNRRIESWTIDVDAPKGIPYRADHSGGWKGDRVYGFGVDLPHRRDDWVTDAQAAIEAWVLKQRADSGFRRPDPVETSA
jgi:hypothetical protein